MIEQSVELEVMGRVMNLYSMLLVLGPAMGAVLFEIGSQTLGMESGVLTYPIIFIICSLALVIPPKRVAENA